MKLNINVVDCIERVNEVIDTLIISQIRITIVVNKHKQVVGTITQGDIIRYLRSKNEHAVCMDIMETNFTFLRSDATPSLIKVTMKDKKLAFLPILNGQDHLLRVITPWDFL